MQITTHETAPARLRCCGVPGSSCAFHARSHQIRITGGYLPILQPSPSSIVRSRRHTPLHTQPNLLPSRMYHPDWFDVARLHRQPSDPHFCETAIYPDESLLFLHAHMQRKMTMVFAEDF